MCEKSTKHSAIFNGKIETRERCKGVYCADLGESFPTSIYLQKFGFDTAENEPCKVCPLSAYRFPRYEDNPFFEFFQKGLNCSLSTDDPLTGLQIRGSKFQSSNSNFRELELTNLLRLFLGCIEAKFCK